MLLLTSAFIVDEMASKSVMAKFCHYLLKKQTAEEGKSNNPDSIGSEDPKFTSILGSFALEVQPQKKQWTKKSAAKEKVVVEVDTNVSPTSMEKFDINIISKIFPYQEFMDRKLMIVAYLE